MTRRNIWFVLDTLYYVEDGIIRCEPHSPPRPWYKLLDEGDNALSDEKMQEAEDDFLAELAEHGYHPQPLYLDSFLNPMVGKTWEELLREADLRAAKNIRSKEIRVPRCVETERWEYLRTRFDNNIIGINKKYINTHPSGFSIRILMKADSKENRKRYAEEHRNDILTWCIEELSNCRGILLRIGKPEYYTPKEIIVLQSNELEVLFEVKTSATTPPT